MSKIRTTLNFSAAARNADEHEVEVEITYTVHHGCQATYTQPGEDDSVLLNSVTVIEANGDTYGADWLVGLLEDDDEIDALCLADWHESRIAAEEYRAEARREDRELGL